jgi:hypothetical protein
MSAIAPFPEAVTPGLRTSTQAIEDLERQHDERWQASGVL